MKLAITAVKIDSYRANTLCNNGADW